VVAHQDSNLEPLSINSVDAMSGARYPEADYSIEERADAVASILLEGATRILAARNRAKVRRFRARNGKSADKESRCCDGKSEP
jgi:hypothetical protein